MSTTEDQMMLRDFLRNFIGLSRQMVKVLKFDGGEMLVNNDPVTVRKVLKEGDLVELIFPKEMRSPRLKPEKMALDIVYEDEYLLILNKQAEVAVSPSMSAPNQTIANGLIDYYNQHDLDYTVHIVTRLDRNTTGLMLVAKQQFIHSFFHQIEIERHYQAIVEGEMKEEKGTINDPIGRKPDSIIQRMVTDTGQKAVTHYQVVKQFENRTLLDVQLETGRTHQIRVHFSNLGHPLLGDTLYGGTKGLIDRQALHCSHLSFIHPILKKALNFQSKLPKDMDVLI